MSDYQGDAVGVLDGLFRRERRSILGRQIEATLCGGMTLPEEFERLFGWIERRKLFVDTRSGRIGFLFPEAEMKKGWTKSGRPGGTNIEIAAEGNANLRYWFRTEEPEVMERLCVFAKTGGEGSMAAFWLADDGTQKIVHLGSGSGSVTLCVLAETPVDFLRLLAIGYDEICWGDDYSRRPDENEEFRVQPNHPYRDWIEETFKVSIPERASDIVRHPSSMDDPYSDDPFWKWVKTHVG